jgi:hypothetical protein
MAEAGRGLLIHTHAGGVAAGGIAAVAVAIPLFASSCLVVTVFAGVAGIGLGDGVAGEGDAGADI